MHESYHIYGSVKCNVMDTVIIYAYVGMVCLRLLRAAAHLLIYCTEIRTVPCVGIHSLTRVDEVIPASYTTSEILAFAFCHICGSCNELIQILIESIQLSVSVSIGNEPRQLNHATKVLLGLSI